MDALNTLWLDWLWTQAPLEPRGPLPRLYTGLAWGLLLASLALALLRLRGVRDRRWLYGLPLLLLLWCLWPGDLSPTFWLRLAFRAPSLTAAGLCAWYLLAHFRPQFPAPPFEAARRWAVAPLLLGWLLLLDTFALLPVSVYALGFAPLVLGALVLLCLLPWLLSGAGRLSALLVGALACFVLLRLPTGNVWDALIDPWFWLVLQFDWLRRCLHRRRAGDGPAPA